MGNKIGPNEKCPCGSDLKYKRCCKNKNDDMLSIERDENWNNLYVKIDDLNEHILKYLEQNYPNLTAKKVRSEFCFYDDDLNAFIINDVIFHWYLYNSVPALFEQDDFIDMKTSPALRYLESNRDKITEIDQELIETITASPVSFFHIKSIIPNKRLVVYDILLDKEYTIKDNKISDMENNEFIIYGRVITYMDQTILLDVGSVIFNDRLRKYVLKLKDHIANELSGEITSEKLCDFNDEVRGTYFSFCKNQFIPAVHHIFEDEFQSRKNIMYEFNCQLREVFETIVTSEERRKEILSDGDDDSIHFNHYLEDIDENADIDLYGNILDIYVNEDAAEETKIYLEKLLENRIKLMEISEFDEEVEVDPNRSEVVYKFNCQLKEIFETFVASEEKRREIIEENQCGFELNEEYLDLFFEQQLDGIDENVAIFLFNNILEITVATVDKDIVEKVKISIEKLLGERIKLMDPEEEEILI